MTNTSEKKTSKSLLVISCLLLLFLIVLSLFFIYRQKQKSEATDGHLFAYIYQNGGKEAPTEIIDLSEVKETYTITLTCDNSSYNVIEVRPGEIGVIEASCPDHICIDTGFIHSSGIPIVCLPNQLIIEIKADTDIRSKVDTDIDSKENKGSTSKSDDEMKYDAVAR